MSASLSVSFFRFSMTHDAEICLCGWGVELSNLIGIDKWISTSLAMLLRPSDGERADGGVSRSPVRGYVRYTFESALEIVRATFSCAGSRHHPPSHRKDGFTHWPLIVEIIVDPSIVSLLQRGLLTILSLDASLHYGTSHAGHPTATLRATISM